MNTLNLYEQNHGAHLCVIRSSILPAKESLIHIKGEVYKVDYIDFSVEIVDGEAVLEAAVMLDQL